MASITLKNIKKIYDNKVTAVHDFNLEIQDKEFVVLVGPSGCGKSTTLRMIAGLEDISEGDLLIDGKRVNEVEPKDRDIAMVFQNYALYPHMTVFENMAFSLKLRKMPKNEIEERVNAAAEMLGITEYLKRKPKALSGGQRQRVAIGRAIVREPKAFLMDEPLSNLDAKLRNQMRAELIKLRYRLNSTFVYVTHDQTEAMTLGDRIVIMKDGFVQQIGTPQEVFNRPANLFVAGFIGVPQMNFIPGKLEKDGDNYYVLVNGARIVLAAEQQKKLAARQQEACSIKLGVRPEHIEIAAEETTETLKGTIDVAEMMGSEIHLHIKSADQDLVLRIPNAAVGGEEPGTLQYGAELHFRLRTEMLHLFDAESEKNLIAE